MSPTTSGTGEERLSSPPELLEKGLQTQFIEQRVGHYYYLPDPETEIHLGNGREAALEYLHDDRELRESLWADLAQSDHPATLPPGQKTEDIKATIRETGHSQAERERFQAEDGELGPLELAEAVVCGDIPAEEVPNRLLAWANDRVNIPYVPEAAEDAIARALASVLEEIVLDRIERAL